MDRKRLAPRLCFLVSAALTLCGVILRTVCMLTQYDADLGYFEIGPLPTVSRILYYVVIVAATVTALLIPKDALGGELRTPYRAPFAYVTGIILVAFAVLAFLTSYAVLFTSKGLLKTVLTLSAIFASGYFILSGNRHGRFRDGLTALGFVPLAWSMVAVAVTYSDPYVAMNSPVKLSLQMGLLGFMFILISELRYRLGRALPRGGIALTAIGFFCAVNAAVPLLAAGSMIRDPLYLLCAGVLLAAGLYGGYMLFSYTFHATEAPAREPDGEDPASDDDASPEA